MNVSWMRQWAASAGRGADEKNGPLRWKGAAFVLEETQRKERARARESTPIGKLTGVCVTAGRSRNG